MIKFGTLSEREEKCIQNAKKQIAQEKKWGHWIASLNLFFSIVLITAAITGIFFIINFVEKLAAMGNPANANQQMIDAAKQGLALGMTFGLGFGVFIFKGLFYLCESIKQFRGDITNNLLIKYHDGIVALMQNHNDDRLETVNDQPTD
jgi:hypothetical protein